MATTFVGFMVIERIPVKASIVLYEVGNTWLIAFLYLFIAFLLADILSLCHIIPKTFLKNSLTGLLTILGLVAAPGRKMPAGKKMLSPL